MRLTALPWVLVFVGSLPAQPSDWAALSPSTVPTALTGHVMVTDGLGALSFGGNGVGVYYDETWRFDGSTWAQLTPPVSPSPRRRHGGAYDLARGRFVVFGGQVTGNGLVGDTWEFDGTTWSQLAPTTSPSPRRDHCMVYDVQNGVVLLFSGRDGSGAVLPDMWAWDGSNWTQLTPAALPPPRFDGQMTWDPTTSAAVLFGGRGSGGAAPFSDTWLWSGNNWTQASPLRSPSARYTHAMTYDEVRQRVVAFGGYDGARYLEETWEYDGSTWTQRGDPVIPGRRGGPQLIHVPALGSNYLFGGFYGGALSDTWELRPNRSWQPDSGIAALDVNGLPAAGFWGPDRRRLLVGQGGGATLDSSQTGAGWDVGFSLAAAAPFGAGGLQVPGGQLVNLDLTTLAFVNGGALLTPWPGGTLSLPFTGGGPVVASGQMLVVDPAQQLGFALSRAGEITVSDAVYLEDLDAVPLSPAYTYPSGWSNSPGTNGWIIWNGSTPTANTGPPGDHTSGQGSYAYCETSSPWSTATFTLDMGPRSTAGLTSPTLDFWFHMHGNNAGTLDVESFDGLSWTSIWNISGDQGVSWQNARVPLTPVSNTVQFRFRYQAVAENGDVAIDDIALGN